MMGFSSSTMPTVTSDIGHSIGFQLGIWIRTPIFLGETVWRCVTQLTIGRSTSALHQTRGEISARWRNVFALLLER